MDTKKKPHILLELHVRLSLFTLPDVHQEVDSPCSHPDALSPVSKCQR